jgi:hypothetical protein
MPGCAGDEGHLSGQLIDRSGCQERLYALAVDSVGSAIGSAA